MVGNNEMKGKEKRQQVGVVTASQCCLQKKLIRARKNIFLDCTVLVDVELHS